MSTDLNEAILNDLMSSMQKGATYGAGIVGPTGPAGYIPARNIAINPTTGGGGVESGNAYPSLIVSAEDIKRLELRLMELEYKLEKFFEEVKIILKEKNE